MADDEQVERCDAPSAKFRANTYKSELFARGYLLTDSTKKLFLPEGWSQCEFGHLTLAHDPRLAEHEASVDSARLVCLGLICDVRYPNLDATTVVETLVNALANGESELFEALSWTCGRYILVGWRGSRRLLLTDATGMKAAYYYKQEANFIASHVNLIGWNGENAKPRRPIASTFGYPGICGPLQNTYLLTPNSMLDLDSMQPVRFWPKRKVEERSIYSLEQEFLQCLKGAVEHYTQNYRPVVSITGGLDSRTTLALTKGMKIKPHYFTYYRSDRTDTDLSDRQFAIDFTEVSGCPVDIFDLSEFARPNKDFLDVAAANTNVDHIKKLSWIYYKKFNDLEDAVHLRSNVSEVGREFWGNRDFPIKDGRGLTRLYLRVNAEYKAKYIFRLMERFDDFAEKTKIIKCADKVDLKSLFYWEFRMASWHSNLVAESDPAFDTVSIFNCRRTLEIMLSAPKRERASSTLLRRVIAREWPELTSFAVNGEPFWPC